jgi:hypothetical protein
MKVAPLGAEGTKKVSLGMVLKELNQRDGIPEYSKEARRRMGRNSMGRPSRETRLKTSATLRAWHGRGKGGPRPGEGRS